MNVIFEDSFWKSLKTLSRHQTWWYKTYDFFRRGIPNFLKNIWFFRKQLWDFRSWDYSYNLQLFARSLEATSDLLENYGNEIEKTRNKKVQKIKRSIYLLHRIRTEDYITDAEKELGELKNTDFFSREDTNEEREHNRKVFTRATELEEQECNELWEILKGQDKKDFNKIYENLSKEEKMKFDHWENWFDGSGIKNWWD
jgi:hypothetical protein